MGALVVSGARSDSDAVRFGLTVSAMTFDELTFHE